MTAMSSSTSSPASSFEGADATGAGLERIGSDAPPRDSRPVGAGDRAVVAVVSDMDAAQDTVERLIAAGIGPDHVSVVGKDAQSQRRVNGFVTTGSVAGPSAAAGAWIGGGFGLLMGTALLFVPGAGPLIVLGPLAAAAVGAAEGGLLGGAVAVLLGHFVEDDERQRYEQLVRDGCCLIVVHGDEQDVARARQLLERAGTIETRRQDAYRGPGPRIGPIHLVHEGMQVADASGATIGKVVLVKMGDPGAVTVEHDPNAEPYLPGELAERFLRTASSKSTVRVCSSRTSTRRRRDRHVDRDLVRLSLPVDRLAPEARTPDRLVAMTTTTAMTTMTSRPAYPPAFLFDLDGTLVDSVYQHVLAWQEALDARGIELSVWRIHRRIGMSGGLFVNALLRETGARADRRADRRACDRAHAAGLRALATTGPPAARRARAARLR